MIKQKIILGDAITKMQEIASETVDLVIADPPYNLGKEYGNNHDIKSFEEYLHFSRKWTKEAYRILKPHGTIYVFIGFRFISYLYDILDKSSILVFT
ncbi:hypothetical protein H6F32_13630 [Anabaena sp. FACHB-1237]|uniref:DNA methyltransferase n=1 Tax=Anabaena sp. FACHB-1237 TaxID=2692769 RepID=UPI001680778C|nr:DNA methyltransferase [Anabaena sp. FACHB-1237]MBD2138606.1 hypothetical protein [Anabaena sp. FACHB-1237]